MVQELGGKARRFTKADGDLATISGQRKLMNVLQTTQPEHIWMAPECRLWGSWTFLNASRSLEARLKLQADREADQVHLRLCARLHAWQVAKGRHFHIEQPELSKMLLEPTMSPIVQKTHRLVVDMCAFGLKTPVSKIPIRKGRFYKQRMNLLLDPCNPECVQVILTTNRWPEALLITRGIQCGPLASPVPTAQVLRSFLLFFFKSVASAILEQSVHAADDELPRTRKRFKTSLGGSVPISHLQQRKRTGGTESQTTVPEPKVPRPTVDTVSPEATVGINQPLQMRVWLPVFQIAKQCTTKAPPALIPADHELVPELKQRIEGMEIQQVFVGRKSRTLHCPVGVLPPTVAPLRLSIALMRDPS